MLRTTSGVAEGQVIEGVRRKAQVDFSMSVPFGFISGLEPPVDLRIAAILHLFHPDLSAEFLEALTQVPGCLDVFISTDSDEKSTEILKVFRNWEKGDVDVRVLPNRGRDIGPRLTAFRDVHAKYDLLLYLQSKRDSHLVDGPPWRRYLLHSLVGSPAIVRSILEAFHRDQRLGIIMPQHWGPIRHRLDWGSNFIGARNLSRRMGIRLTPAHVIDFPSGSMFWARPAALRPILDLGLRPEDFPEESGQFDGTLAHVLERLFLYACEAAEYRWVKVCDSAGSDDKRAVISIDTAGALDVYRQRFDYRLTALGPR
ncbi:rhamnan synthesis F family protein [Acidisphaera sp. S103]|uniref:rhamnan synthesis F family protein n=1 Tax=Acidisphaera sp. S103 TaxID=1747223 RepID=UPI00131C74EF|nr:rhamnan synthesis F family protein [Acidisphaera sp. S103]